MSPMIASVVRMPQSRLRRSGVRGLAALALLSLAAAASATQTALPVADTASGNAAAPGPRADFGTESASPETRRIAHWALHSGDHAGMPYLIVDKVEARVFVFDKDGRLQGAGPALLGMERGDGSAQGLGQRQLAAIAPQERTTPAGRFVASLAKDLKGQEILWIDYDSALALHRVAKGTPAERRGERLQSASAEDNRISYGCINVPVAFYERVVSPAFTHSSGVVYILPETRPAQEFFKAYDVEGADPLPGAPPA